MCRHLAYLGPPTDLSGLLLTPESSLLRQSYAPQDMRGSGSVNADGFGVGWYVDDPHEPRRYRRVIPMWADANLPDLARTTRSHAVLAAARNGTVGMPVTETACAPFRAGRWLFSHNGYVAGWPDSVAHLAATLPLTDLMSLDAPTDSALLWALLRHRLREGSDLADAVAALTVEVGAAAPGSRINLLATDGETAAASTWGHSLSVLVCEEQVVVASEPFGPPVGGGVDRWRPVPERHLVVAVPGKADIHPLEAQEGTTR